MANWTERVVTRGLAHYIGERRDCSVCLRPFRYHGELRPEVEIKCSPCTPPGEPREHDATPEGHPPAH